MADADYTNEIWKTIPYAPEYAVSDMGRVKRLIGRERCQAGKLIVTSLAGQRRNYVYVGFIHSDGIRRTKGMHVVVLETFVCPKPAGHEAAHRDGNSQNNTLANLAWKTPKDNAADKTAHGTQPRGEKHGISKLNAKKVRDIRMGGATQLELARRHNVSQTCVSHVLSGKTWGHVI